MKPNELSNEAANRIIHERLMGKCWHEFIADEVIQKIRPCRCGTKWNARSTPDNPDYCSGKSERNLLREAVAAAQSKFGIAYVNRILCSLYVFSDYCAEVAMVQLSPDKISRCLVACIQEQDNGK